MTMKSYLNYERKIIMKVIAKETLKNAYDQILFVAGRTYKVVDTDSKRAFILNELHSETPVRIRELEKDFIIEE